MKSPRLPLAASVVLWLAGPSLFGQARATPAPRPGPENVLVVVNKYVSVSGRIARYYAEKRKIPDKNICSILTTDEDTVSREDFEGDIEKPIRQCLEKRGLTETVLYIALTKGVPIRVSGPGEKLRMERASTDSELALLYSKIHGKPAPVPGPAGNPFYRQTQTPFSHPAFPMYLVTRLDAYDFEAVKGMIDRAIAAETADSSQGKVYLDMRDGGEGDGESWLRDAMILLPAGRGVLEQTNAVVYNQKNAIGYASWGSNDPRHKERRLNFQWLPGALATEYVSTDGRTFAPPPANWRIGTWADASAYYFYSPQSMTADFIADGATGASGHVDEPYLQFTPRPDLLFPAYLAGKTLAEAFYASLPAVSWMNIILGDPLCRLKAL